MSFRKTHWWFKQCNHQRWNTADLSKTSQNADEYHSLCFECLHLGHIFLRSSSLPGEYQTSWFIRPECEDVWGSETVCDVTKTWCGRTALSTAQGSALKPPIQCFSHVSGTLQIKQLRNRTNFLIASSCQTLRYKLTYSHAIFSDSSQNSVDWIINCQFSNS